MQRLCCCLLLIPGMLASEEGQKPAATEAPAIWACVGRMPSLTASCSLIHDQLSCATQIACRVYVPAAGKSAPSPGANPYPYSAGDTGPPPGIPYYPGASGPSAGFPMLGFPGSGAPMPGAPAPGSSMPGDGGYGGFAYPSQSSYPTAGYPGYGVPMPATQQIALRASSGQVPAAPISLLTLFLTGSCATALAVMLTLCSRAHQSQLSEPLLDC
eukprot:TRINITY_DN103221_c0_g1_i1.p2 TRINITY_DN103221_c0_g1~~TRINITY_DN103221_c0_g1_i1.p2  ORF type:complete len:214 (-),score=33.19 TRINITY_DN103221_c0_g1_i1:66-707(-)